jgi:hypothetical protein
MLTKPVLATVRGKTSYLKKDSSEFWYFLLVTTDHHLFCFVRLTPYSYSTKEKKLEIIHNIKGFIRGLK